MLRLVLIAWMAFPMLAAAWPRAAAAGEPDPDRPRKIVILAGEKSHGPVGNGIHDYGWSAKLLKVMLANSNVADRITVELHLDGWPADPATLDTADTIMVISDGRDGDNYTEAPHLSSPDHVAAIQRQIDRGCGFITFHFSTFAPDARAEQILDWSGAYFDWETDGVRQWYSNIQTLEAEVRPAADNHPVLRGVGPFRLHEEFYYDLRFHPDDGATLPIWEVPALPGREPRGRVVAWVRERPDGGRGFGTTAGHFYANWEVPEFRRTILNALVWTAGLDVPDGGVQAPFFTHAEITRALAAENAAAPGAEAAKKPGRQATLQELGFRWIGDDSSDGRWNETQIGPVLASIVPFESGAVAKGMTIRVGESIEAAVCYDTERMCLRAGWTGGFLKFDPQRFGIINSPVPEGEIQFESRPVPGWDAADIAYRGQHRHNGRVVLESEVDGTRVLESPWIESHGEQLVFVRQLELGPHATPLTMNIAHFVRPARIVEHRGRTFALSGEKNNLVCVSVCGPGSLQTAAREDGVVTLTFPASDQSQRCDILIWRGSEEALPDCAAQLNRRPAPPALTPLLQPGSLQWPEILTTQGTLGNGEDAYTIDTVTLPFDNPYRALLFVSGHDFFRDGRAALCAIHGDVWLADGIDADLDAIRWKRFATGLFQPLGLKIIDDVVYVIGRDQITQLYDRNRDGEADYYENFCNQYLTSTEGHDFVTCLETDPQGNLYFAHGVQGVVRVSPDGKRVDTIATGLRNPNGLGVGPQGMITVSPQEGNWTPVSSIAVVHEGAHFGFGGPRVTDERPLGYDPPICWLPRLADNSSGGQVWAVSDRWGPFGGRMLHLSYGQCRALLTLIEEVDGVLQGGAVTLPGTFLSGVMRGRVHPIDGQVYLSGLKGWTTRAADDGCLQRLRYTGKPAYLPVAVRTYANGIALTFTDPLDPDSAQDPDGYHIEQWNYLWSKAYGSADYRPSQPGTQGHDVLDVQSATLFPDGRTVFLELAGLAPVMQMQIDYQIRAADGHELRNTYFHTIHHVPASRIDDSQIVRRARQRLPAEVEAALKPGLLVRFESSSDAAASAPDCRVDRLLALAVEPGEAATPFLPVGPFRARFEGYLHSPLRGTYELSLEGAGDVRLTVNGVEVLSGRADDLATLGAASCRLHGGYNAVVLEYGGLADGSGHVRLLWDHDTFAREPVPPTAWFHRSDDPELVRCSRLRAGRELFATLHCSRCHLAANGETAAMPELRLDPPSLAGTGTRLHTEWIEAWLLSPAAVRPQARMPALFRSDDPTDRQAAADVAAFLATLTHSDAVQSAGAQRPAASHERGTVPPAADAARSYSKQPDGGQLYEDLACLACHRLTPPGEPDAHNRLSLAFAETKYRPGALASYLLEPQRHHQGSRMPDFRLSPDEAESLADFLRQHSTTTDAPLRQPAANAGDPQRGRAVFEARRCAACHSIDRPDQVQPAPPPIIPIQQADRGCLANGDELRSDVPRYSLSDEQRSALQAFLNTGLAPLNSDTPAEAAERLVRQLNCAACHVRDGANSPRQQLAVEEGSGIVPDALPNLTWTGEKLKPEWLRAFLAGDVNHPLRPWLRARMPAFPAFAPDLAAGLRAQHGLPREVNVSEIADAELAAVGRELTLPSALDCRQCHGVGREEPRGDEQTRIALGLNFSDSRARLRRDYFDRFMLNPPRCDPGLRMPILAPDGRTTKVTRIYDGNAARQFEALWHYLQSVPPREADAAQLSPGS